MDTHDIDETTDTITHGESNDVVGIIQSEFRTPPTETLISQELVDGPLELVIRGPNPVVPNNSIQSCVNQKNGRFNVGFIVASLVEIRLFV